MAFSASMFYIAIDYWNKTAIKVSTSNINIKMHELFSKQRIIDVWVTTRQLKGLDTNLILNSA